MPQPDEFDVMVLKEAADLARKIGVKHVRSIEGLGPHWTDPNTQRPACATIYLKMGQGGESEEANKAATAVLGDKPKLTLVTTHSCAACECRFLSSAQWMVGRVRVVAFEYGKFTAAEIKASWGKT